MSETFPPTGPTTLTQTLPSYLYVQYNDDVTLQAFVDAYNALAQTYIECFANLNLPVYTNGNIAGALLDWVGQGLYGVSRPSLPTIGIPAKGPYGSSPYGGLAYAKRVPAVPSTFYATSDDVYKRIITWAFYKGDGKVCSIGWLKNRIHRFLNGLNGAPLQVDQTNDVSIHFTGPYAATITVPSTPIASIFQVAVESGAIEMPLQWTWTVVVGGTITATIIDSSGAAITDSSSQNITSTSPI
jgi:hypothetical protein